MSIRGDDSFMWNESALRWLSLAILIRRLWTFRVLIGLYDGGEGRLSDRRSSKYEASQRGMGPSVAAASYPVRLMPGIPGKCFLIRKVIPNRNFINTKP